MMIMLPSYLCIHALRVWFASCVYLMCTHGRAWRGYSIQFSYFLLYFLCAGLHFVKCEYQLITLDLRPVYECCFLHEYSIVYVVKCFFLSHWVTVLNWCWKCIIQWQYSLCCNTESWYSSAHASICNRVTWMHSIINYILRFVMYIHIVCVKLRDDAGISTVSDDVQ